MMKSNKLWADIVSQWKDLYIDYRELKIFINSLHSIIDQNNQICEKWKQKQNNSIALNIYYPIPGTPQYNHNMLLINKNSEQINSMFNYIYETQALICLQFCRCKYEEVEYRHMLCSEYGNIARQGQVINYLQPYIQYNYIQAAYLTRFLETNLEIERKILKKHLYYVNGAIKTHDRILANSFNPSLKVVDDVVERIQNLYIDKFYPLQDNKNKKPKEMRDYLRSLATKIQTPNYDTFASGVFVGMFLAVVVFLSLLLIYKNKSVETDPIFKRDFSTWRGIAIIILYIWVTGLNVSLYRQYNISHYLAFEFKSQKWLTSTKLFKLSGIFSTLYVVLFSLYVLNLSTLINLKPFQPQYLVLIIWLAFIFFMINPFPIMYYKTRTYIFKRLLKLPTSLCIGITFTTSFISTQLMSLFVPIEDFIYTMCYFSVLDFTVVEKVNACKRPAQACIFVFTLLIFIYKLLQHLKQGLEKQLTIFSIQFLMIFRYILVIIVAIVSFVYQDEQIYYNVWVIVGITAMIIFCITDVVYEWDLGQISSNNFLLRNNISYPKLFYYVIIAINLILRFNWICTMSQNIISKNLFRFDSNPQLFRLIVGSIEILRVCSWNMLTIQKPVLKNCQQFKAIPQIRNTIQKIILQRIKEEGENKEQQKVIYRSIDFEQKMIDIRSKVQELWKNKRQIEQKFKNKQKQIKQTHSILKIMQIYYQTPLYFTQLQDRLQTMIKISNPLIKHKIYLYHAGYYQNMGYKKINVIDIIPEWKQIYLKYDFLKNFISMLQLFLAEKSQQQNRINVVSRKSESHNYPISNNLVSFTLRDSQDVDNLTNQLNSVIKEINVIYLNAFKAQSTLCIQFIKRKYQQVQFRHIMSISFAKTANQQEIKNVLIPFIQYNYMESIYISRFYQRTQQAQNKLLIKHERYTKGVLETHNRTISPQLKQTMKNLDSLTKEIQAFYVYRVGDSVDNYQRKIKEKRDFLRKLVTTKQIPHHQIFTSGVFFGIFIAVAIFMTLLLIYKRKSVETDPIFNRDFPTWRGIALIIFYMWTQGANLYVYEQYKISHHLVFDFNQHHRSTSTRIFKLAGVFSTLYVVLFSVYVLNLGQVIYLKTFSPRYLVLIIWIIFFFFMFNPFPIIYYQTRRFIIKNFIRLPGLLCFPIPFIYTYTVSQLLTLITPFQDVIYTICYFTKMDFDVVSKQNICKEPSKNIRFIFLMFLLLWKLLQFIKHAIEKGKFLFSNQFYLIIRYCFLMMTAITSQIYQSGNTNLFLLWLGISVVSSGYSHYMDVTNDWDLAHKDSKYFFLRNRIHYPQNYYYFMIVTDAFLRFTWAITLSPNIAEKYFGSPQLLSLTTGALQIFRRQNWNTGRIQKGQLRNCDQFKSIPSIRATFQKEIKKKLQENKVELIPLQRKQNEEYKGPDIEKNTKNIRKKVTEIETNQKQYQKQLSYKVKEADYLLQKLKRVAS